MRYCHHCHRLTAGQPLFCNYCGRSYDVKLCPRMHRNPRAAQACSECGSKELSSPQPKIPLLLRPFLLLVYLGPGGMLLIGLAAGLALFIGQLLKDSSAMGIVVLIALGLGLSLVGWFKSHAKGKAKR
jgi:predicted amidophosphoribosyltransferase